MRVTLTTSALVNPNTTGICKAVELADLPQIGSMFRFHNSAHSPTATVIGVVWGPDADSVAEVQLGPVPSQGLWESLQSVGGWKPF